jgi:isoleucyl-tRNA synthetase
MDYSQTVNLPKTDFPMKADLPKREPQFLEQWEKEQVYAAALKRREAQKDKKRFVLHDGPPYANGHLHLGHALNKILKDIIVRYKTMAGFYAPYVPGWDCHGLPIELQLMKELKITDKNKVDRETFRAQAGAFAQKFVDIQRAEFKRLGVLGDWDHPYLTMAESFKKVIVEAFLDLQKKGCVYRGKKPVYWCSMDETALAEAEVEYENDPGPSIYVAFRAAAFASGDDWADGKTSFVIWTTTPWTLPANVAIAYNPEERYVLAKAADGRRFIVAEKRFEEFTKASGLTLEPIDNRLGESFAGATAKHPWIEDRSVRVLPAGFVAMDTGTGLVHIAPGHGAEDFQLGQQHKLPVLSPVDDRGRFTDEVPQWQGLHVFKANPLILDFLKSNGALLHSEEITHSYPHCWRCHKPVIFRATEQWFLNIDHDGLRDRLRKAIDEVEWIPAYGKNRIGGMIESRPDWCLSRQRLWGTAIPGSANAADKKDPDILDVWFESGVSWAAVLRQPSPWPGVQFPADLYLEGSDQHRGWFQTSLIPSVALEGRPPYKAVLTHGFVMDGQGRPMSKSLGNVIAPEEVIKQYGADLLRLWVGSIDYGGDVRLSPDILKQTADTYRKIRNTFRYLLGNLAGFDPANKVVFAQMPLVDRWALSKLRVEVEEAIKAYDAYEFQRVSSRLVHFCTATLSGFYLDLLKDRLYCDPAASLSRRSAQTVLWHLSDILTRVWAPILSFTADEAWRAIGHAESVALADMPSAPAEWNESQLDEIFPVRDKILEALEKARQAGRMKGNLEAKVVLFGGPNQELVQRYAKDWAAFCIVSQVEIRSTPLETPEAEVHGIQIQVLKADGQKCARCWIYKTDVGQESRWPDVCGRCGQALAALEQDGRLTGTPS